MNFLSRLNFSLLRSPLRKAEAAPPPVVPVIGTRFRFLGSDGVRGAELIVTGVQESGHVLLRGSGDSAASRTGLRLDSSQFRDAVRGGALIQIDVAVKNEPPEAAAKSEDW